MPRAASNIVSPLIAMRPRSGRRIPAMALTTEVLPAPERPKSAVTPSPPSNAAARRNSPRLRSTSSESIVASYAARGAPHHDFGEIQRGEREHDREHAQTQRRGVARRDLGVGVDRKRQRARLAGDVRYEGDGRAELSEATRKRQEHTGDDARERKRERHGEKDAHPPCPKRARRVLERAVYGLEREPDRAHHQRKAHDPCRERSAGPAESDHDAEPLLEDLAERAATTEQQQQEIAHHDRRQHQRQVHGRVEQRLARKARAREDIGDCYREREADDDAPERHTKAEQEDLLLLGAQSQHQKPYFLKISPAPGLVSHSMNPAAAGFALATTAIG